MTSKGSNDLTEMAQENSTMELFQKEMIGMMKEMRSMMQFWVIVDRLTKTTHVIPYGTGLTLDGLAKLYVNEIVRLHGTPKNIVSDRKSRLTARFWNSFQKAMGSELAFSTVFHPQSDG